MPDLSRFTGTEGYHYLNFMRNLKFTDGMAFLADKCGAFWLADIVASVQHKPKVKAKNAFLVWRIVVKDSKAVVDAHWDSEGIDEKTKLSIYAKDKEVYTQKVNYTDFPEGTFEFYQVADVVLLRSEY